MRTKTLRPQRKTYTDKLADAKTWQEVMALDPDDYNYLPVVQLTPEWEASMPHTQAGTHTYTYDELASDIDNICTEKEAYVLYAIVDQEMSFRYLGQEMGVSHETVRNYYKSAIEKLRSKLNYDIYLTLEEE
jgi:DNA-directed RNA polymerase specialized sigma subunit